MEWYNWFFNHQCGLFGPAEGHPAACPVVNYQMQNYAVPREAPLFFPETLYGLPQLPNGERKDVWYLAINPGQGINNEQYEMYCPNTEVNSPQDVQDYANRYLTWYQEQHVDQRHNTDRATGGALAVELLRAGHHHTRARVMPYHPEFNWDILGTLTVANVVHCKCPDWAGVPFTPEVTQLDLWNVPRCGAKTFEMIVYSRPRVVVCLGAPVRDWLGYQTGLHDGLNFELMPQLGQHEQPQAIGGEVISALNLNDARVVRLTINEYQTSFIIGRHPSRWPVAHVQLLARMIDQCLAH